MRTNYFICLTIIFICVLPSAKLKAQTDSSNISSQGVNLQGPRVGVTYISEGELADQLKDEFNVNPFITQFGWQFEKRFFTLDSGVSGLVEGVLLAGGIEQGKILPSGTFLIGVRSANGFEFGFGPNLSLAGVAFAISAGITLSTDQVNFPLNFAVVPSPEGVRLSFLMGFNAKTR
jgi:hypothetical protein